MSVPVCTVYMCVCSKWSLGLAWISSVSCSIWQQWRVPRWPALLQRCEHAHFSLCVYVCVFVADLVFVLVPAASLLTGSAGNASALTQPLVPVAQPKPGGHWWGVMGVLLGDEGGGGDSSVTLTRAHRPLSQSGIAHPQCQKGEFIFLAPALPSARYRGPPCAGLSLPLL